MQLNYFIHLFELSVYNLLIEIISTKIGNNAYCLPIPHPVPLCSSSEPEELVLWDEGKGRP